jgi:hypothetical protein
MAAGELSAAKNGRRERLLRRYGGALLIAGEECNQWWARLQATEWSATARLGGTGGARRVAPFF